MNKFKIKKEELINNLGILTKIVNEKSTIKVLGSVLFELKNNKLKITGTDLEINIFIEIFLESGVLDEISFLMPLKNLYQFVSLAKSEYIDFETEETQIIIKDNKTNVKIPLQPKEDFPVIKQIEDFDSEIILNSQDLQNSLNFTGFAMAVDGIRPALNGILFKTNNKKLITVGTDGYKLSEYIGQETTEDFSFIIPTKPALFLISVLSNSGEITLSKKDNILTIKRDNLSIQFNLLDVTFPDYKQVINITEKTIIKANSNDILHAFKMSKIYSPKDTVKLEIEDDISLFCRSEKGSERVYIDVEYTGDKNFIYLRSSQIIDFLSKLNNQEVIISIESSTKPLKITSGENILFVSMPSRDTSF